MATASHTLWTPAGQVRTEVIEADPAGDDLHPDELAYASALTPARRAEWLAGRRALRGLLHERIGAAPPPLLVDERGAPRLPPGVAASISHKRGVAAALLGHAHDGDGWVGLDLEEDAPTRSDLSARILTARERELLEGLDDAAFRHEQRRRFAVKEAIYKAVAPVVRRYVGFAEVTLLASGAPGRAGEVSGYAAHTHAGDLDRLEIRCGLQVEGDLLVAWAGATRRR